MDAKAVGDSGDTNRSALEAGSTTPAESARSRPEPADCTLPTGSLNALDLEPFDALDRESFRSARIDRTMHQHIDQLVDHHFPWVQGLPLLHGRVADFALDLYSRAWTEAYLEGVQDTMQED